MGFTLRKRERECVFKFCGSKRAFLCNTQWSYPSRRYFRLITLWAFKTKQDENQLWVVNGGNARANFIMVGDGT